MGKIPEIKKSNLDNYLAGINRALKRGDEDCNAEMKLAANEPPITGLIVDNPQLEYILDRRFIPYGRAILSYGKKGNGKTSLFFEFAKIFQRVGGYVFLYETEHALDLKIYAKNQGVNIDQQFYVAHPESLEAGTEAVIKQIVDLEKFDPSGEVPVLIGFDSFAGTCTDSEIETASLSTSDSQVGVHARVLSKFYRRIENILAYDKCTFIAMNQERDKIGKMVMNSNGEDSTPAMLGGQAQFYHSSLQYRSSKLKDLIQSRDGIERKIGSQHIIKCNRNKIGREGSRQDAQYDLYAKGGIDWYTPLVRRLTTTGYKMFVPQNKSCTNKQPTEWRVEGCKINGTIYDANGELIKDEVIPVGVKMPADQLGMYIAASSDAKEHIRKAFEIPDLEDEEKVAAFQEEAKVKRTKKKEILQAIDAEEKQDAIKTL